jgi:hypothetical protein
MQHQNPKGNASMVGPEIEQISILGPLTKGGCTMKRVTLVLVITLTLAGCATIQRNATIEKEQMLAAAGFILKPADSPEKLASLMDFPQHQLCTGFKGGKMFFLYADATTCKCLYVGNQKAYQNYQKFALEQKMAYEELYAAQTVQDMQMDWGMWGPWDVDNPW